MLKLLARFEKLSGDQVFSSDTATVMTEKSKRTALLVIDMQRDFVDDERAILHVKGGQAIVPNVIRAVEVARQKGILVVWVVREHDASGRDVELFRRHLYSSGTTAQTVKGSKGAELVDGLVIKEGDYKGAGITNLIITGVQTPNCIRHTVFDAVELDYHSITLLVDATAAATPEVHHANIYDMKNVGVLTKTLTEWCESEE